MALKPCYVSTILGPHTNDWCITITEKQIKKVYEPPHDKTNKMTCEPAKTDQPGHLPSLISLRFPHEETICMGLQLPAVGFVMLQ